MARLRSSSRSRGGSNRGNEKNGGGGGVSSYSSTTTTNVNGNGFAFRGSGFDQKHNSNSRNWNNNNNNKDKKVMVPVAAAAAAAPPVSGPHHIKSRYEQARFLKARVVQQQIQRQQQLQHQKQQQQHFPFTTKLNKQERLVLPSEQQIHHSTQQQQKQQQKSSGDGEQQHKIQHLMQKLTTVNVNNVNNNPPLSPSQLEVVVVNNDSDPYEIRKIHHVQKKKSSSSFGASAGADDVFHLSKTRTDGTTKTKESCESTIPSEEEYSQSSNTPTPSSSNDDDHYDDDDNVDRYKKRNLQKKYNNPSPTNNNIVLGFMNDDDYVDQQDNTTTGSATSLEGASTFDDTVTGASTFDDGTFDETFTFDNGFASDADTTITTKLSSADHGDDDNDTYTATNTVDGGENNGDDDDDYDDGSSGDDDNSTTYLEYMKKRFIRNSRLARHLKQLAHQSSKLRSSTNNDDRVISNSPSDLLGTIEENDDGQKKKKNNDVAVGAAPEDNGTTAKNSVVINFGKIKNTVENIQLTMEEGIEQVLQTAKTMTSTRSTVNNKEVSDSYADDDGDDGDVAGDVRNNGITCGATTTRPATSKSLRCGQVAEAAATVADDTFAVVTNVVRRDHTFDTFGRDGPTNSMVDNGQQPPRLSSKDDGEDNNNMVLTVNREGIQDEQNANKNDFFTSRVDDGHHEMSMALDDLKSGSLSKELNCTTLPMGVDRHDIYVTVDVDDLAASVVTGAGQKQKHNRTYSPTDPPIPSSISNFSYQGPVDLDTTFRELNTPTDNSSSTRFESSSEQKRFEEEIQSALMDDLQTVYTSKTPDDAKLVLCVVVVSVPSLADAVGSNNDKPIQVQRKRSKNSIPSTKKMTMGVTYRLFDPDTLELYSGGLVTTDYLASAPSQLQQQHQQQAGGGGVVNKAGTTKQHTTLTGFVDIVLNKLAPRVAMDVVHKISLSSTTYSFDEEVDGDDGGMANHRLLHESPTDEVSGIVSTGTTSFMNGCSSSTNTNKRMSATSHTRKMKHSSRRSSDFLMEV